jgi:hypothetical protein
MLKGSVEIRSICSDRSRIARRGSTVFSSDGSCKCVYLDETSRFMVSIVCYCSHYMNARQSGSNWDTERGNWQLLS